VIFFFCKKEGRIVQKKMKKAPMYEGKYYLFAEEDQKIAFLLDEVFRILGARSFWDAERKPEAIFLRMWDTIVGLFELRAKNQNIENVMHSAGDVIMRCRGGADDAALDNLAANTSKYAPIIESVHWTTQIALEVVLKELKQVEADCDKEKQLQIIKAISNCWHAVVTKKKETIMQLIDELHQVDTEGAFYYQKTKLEQLPETAWQLFVK